MSTFFALYTSLQRVLRMRLTPLRLSLPCQLLLLAIVAIAYWYTLPSGKVSIPATQAQYAANRPATPSGPRSCLKVLPSDDDAARYDDSLVLTLVPAFKTLNLGPGLRKRTSGKGKKVKWAEERNTMRWCTKWIGKEDEDPGGEHFTEDVVWTRDGCGRKGRGDVIKAVKEEEVEGDRLDDDGDVVMADADGDGDVVLA